MKLQYIYIYPCVARDRIYATDQKLNPKLMKIQGINWPNMFFWIVKNEKKSTHWQIILPVIVGYENNNIPQRREKHGIG